MRNWIELKNDAAEEMKRVLFRVGLDEQARALANAVRKHTRPLMFDPPYVGPVSELVSASIDPVRAAAIAMACRRVELEGVEGCVAECGVYRGETAALLHRALPDRTLYLFDTFEGFPDADLEVPRDSRWLDTSAGYVARRLGDTSTVVFRPGYFPDTARGLEDQRFALVSIDLDLYAGTLAALEFFFPRLSPGGYLFVHDFNSEESARGVERAVTKFTGENPELFVELPDNFGSVVFRKAHTFSGHAGDTFAVSD
jgi:O-methyltransferase